MEYFAGLDVLMEETRVCVVDRDGVVIHEAKAPSTPSGIEAALAGAPACRRVVFETGGMAPMLHHGLTERGVPVVCIESRQASQALKSLATGPDRSQLANVAREAKAVLHVDKLAAVADRGYFNGEEILACEQAGICVTLPKPMTSGAKLEGRFGKQDFIYLPDEDVYLCPAGQH